MIKILSIVCLTMLLVVDCLAARSEWKLGAGVAALEIPFYPGSSQSNNYVLPFPYLLFRSEFLEYDDGLQATFFKSTDVRLDISADLGVPVNSSDSVARNGMPDLDLVLQIGPAVEITLDGGRFEPSFTRLEFPLRAAVAIDIDSLESAGWVFEPRLTVESHRSDLSDFSFLISGGLRYATHRYHDYYYEVQPAFVTPSRSAFTPGGGYSGLFIDAEIDWQQGDLLYFLFARYQNLSGAEYVNSPLVEQEDYWFIGAGLIWVFAASM